MSKFLFNAMHRLNRYFPPAPDAGPPSELCPTGKKIYADEADALIALAKIRGRKNGKQAERRAYHCTQCRGWHLTSREKKP
jgi:hypothetical protein